MNDGANNIDRFSPQLSDEMKGFAADLARLCPRDDRLDRERLAFLAGQASMARTCHESGQLLGLPLDRVWPAAFASMTAIAAALLFALLLRLENPVVRPPATGNRTTYAASQPTIERGDGHGVLSAVDAYSTDLEARLSEYELRPLDGGLWEEPDHDGKSPTLTPTAWQQVVNETQRPQPSPRDGSDRSLIRGVDS